MAVDRDSLGISFSHRQATRLGVDPVATLHALLADIGVRHVRLSLYWDEIAPVAGQLDFAPLRPWLDIAASYGARILMTLGMTAQRRPYFYPPRWMLAEHPIAAGAAIHEQPRLVALLLLMLERATAYLADYDVIDAWQVEHEPLAPRSPSDWRIARGLLEREIRVVRETDPRRRPIVVSHARRSAFDRAWLPALLAGDILGQAVSAHRPLGTGRSWRSWTDHASRLLSPGIRQQALLARLVGRRLWITGLQAEPWEHPGVERPAPEDADSIAPARIRRDLELARRSGAERIYLCGAEWWRSMAERHGDRHYWELARELFGG